MALLSSVESAPRAYRLKASNAASPNSTSSGTMPRSVPAATPQADLFASVPNPPEGMRYVAGLISPDEERALLDKLPALPFKEFEFHGFLGKRRTVSFGWHYDFNGRGLKQAGLLPEFLLPLREQAAKFAGVEPSMLEHALLIEYKPGAGIG